MCELNQIIISQKSKCDQCKFQALARGLKICTNDDPDGKDAEEYYRKRSKEVRNINDYIQKFMPNSRFLNDLLDLSASITEAFAICGIHQCKARNANEAILSAFLQYDELPSEKHCNQSKKRINKDNFFSDLYRMCRFRKRESLIAYAITKYAFRAFYYRQTLIHYDPGYINVCEWKKAVRKMFQTFLHYNEGNECEHVLQVEDLLKCCFDNYVKRCRDRNKCGQDKDLVIEAQPSMDSFDCKKTKHKCCASLFNRVHKQTDLKSWTCQDKNKAPGDPKDCIKPLNKYK